MHSLNYAEDAEHVLAEAQVRLGSRVQLVQAEQQLWYAVFKDGRGYRIEWSDAWGRLMLIAVLGFPTSEHEHQVLNLALSYNALWWQVGKLRMARDGEAGELMLLGELGPEDTEPDVFDSALLHFDGLRRWWGGVLTREGDAFSVSPAPPPLWVGRA